MKYQGTTLRVAIVTSSLKLAGAEKQTFYMARALRHAGVDGRFYYLGSDGHYETALRQSDVPLRQIFKANRPGLMLARLIKSFLIERPDIVLAAQFDDLRYALPAGRICGSNIFGGVRSDGFYELNRHGRWSRLLARHANGLIANSFRAKRNLVSQGIDAQKIAVLHNVIDLSDFDAKSAQALNVQLPADRVFVTAVGNLHSCKRFDRFIEALALARQQEPSLTGLIAGADSGMRTQLQERAQTLGLLPNGLTFLGAIKEVPALLARSAMLILTSDYEGFPNVILEAMAARLPVITVAAGDAGIIVEPNHTGLVVEADDARGLADCIVRLAQNRDLRKRFGEAGRKRAEQEFGCKPLAVRMLKLFRDFAARQRKSRLFELIERQLLELKDEGGCITSAGALPVASKAATEPVMANL